MTTTMLRPDDAQLMADCGHEILSDVCPTCRGDGLLAGLSCPTCAGTGAVYWVARYSASLARIMAAVS